MNAKEIEQEIDESEYEDILSDLYGNIDICGYSYPAWQILKEVDPTAFRCSKIDYEDSLDRKWECGECGTEYDNEDEAEECCQPDEDEDY